MIMDYEKLRDDIQVYFPKEGSHAFNHTERVFNLAVTIAKAEKADLDIIKAAALLHDISRKKQQLKKCECHATDGALVAKRLLAKYKFPRTKIDAVCYSISIHRKSQMIKPNTLEAKILQDADRLDAIGAVNISRVILSSRGDEYKRPIYAGDKHASGDNSAINYMIHQIKTLKPEAFHTKTARKLAKKRYEFLKLYVKTFIDEWEGKY